MTERYHLQVGANPEIKAHFNVSGPQNADQVDERIRQLLDKEGVTGVVLLTDFGIYPGVTIYQKIKDES